MGTELRLMLGERRHSADGPQNSSTAAKTFRSFHQSNTARYSQRKR